MQHYENSYVINVEMNSGKEFRDPLMDLITLCKKNDRKAQIRVYELLSKRMFNTSIRIVKNSMVAEDIVQESFITVFNLLDTFRGETGFENWLRRIVINKSIDQLRKEKIQFTDDLDEIEYPDYEDTNYDFQPKRDDQLIDEIKKQVNKLPGGYRIIFSLFYIEGYDHEEIGQILNISSSTSRSQLTRAKEKLVNQMRRLNVTR
jgi:RNA polymerase sigma factor (sigma-70 family)